MTHETDKTPSEMFASLPSGARVLLWILAAVVLVGAIAGAIQVLA